MKGWRHFLSGLGVMFLALFSLYPVLAAAMGLLTTGILFVSTSMNVVLTTLCVAFYMMIPVGSFDHWFSTGAQLVRMLFPESTSRLLANIDETFQYYEKEHCERAIYMWHPHGLLSVSPAVHSTLHGHSRVACLSMFHTIPVVRDLYAYGRAIPAEYEKMKSVVETESISIVPGGVREMMVTKPREMRLILKGRKGVFKLALETGTPLVPILTYGENELFPPSDSQFLHELNKWLYTQFRIVVPIPSFTSLMNWIQLSESPLPPVRSYAGRPIAVKKTESPTDAEIDELRARYVRRLHRLFRETAPSGMHLHVE